MNEKVDLQEPPKKHLQLAKDVAKEICSNFNPEEQNEAVKMIYSLVANNRQDAIREAQGNLTYLQKSLEDLIG